MSSFVHAFWMYSVFWVSTMYKRINAMHWWGKTELGGCVYLFVDEISPNRHGRKFCALISIPFVQHIFRCALIVMPRTPHGLVSHMAYSYVLTVLLSIEVWGSMLHLFALLSWIQIGHGFNFDRCNLEEMQMRSVV